MAAPEYPFIAFNFSVEIRIPGMGSDVLCKAAFSECDGLDMTMDVKTLREGGNNTQQIRLVGAVNYATLTLKRGMTASTDFWQWFEAQQMGTAAQLRNDFRGEATIVILAEDRTTARARFVLRKCLLTRVKAPALNGKDGTIAIEEMQLAYESLSMMPAA